MFPRRRSRAQMEEEDRAIRNRNRVRAQMEEEDRDRASRRRRRRRTQMEEEDMAPTTPEWMLPPLMWVTLYAVEAGRYPSSSDPWGISGRVQRAVMDLAKKNPTMSDVIRYDEAARDEEFHSSVFDIFEYEMDEIEEQRAQAAAAAAHVVEPVVATEGGMLADITTEEIEEWIMQRLWED
jgi:hypothetical protein